MFRNFFNFGFLRDSGRRPTGRRRRARRPESYRPEVLDLENRTLPSTITWLRPVGGDWDDPANWSGGQVPGTNDDAVIPFAGIQVTHATAAADSAHSLTSEAALDLSGGSLSVGVVPLQTQRIASRIDAPFRVDGGTLTLNSVTLGGAGTLTNFASVNLIGSALNVAVDNEAGMLASGQFTANTINNQADRPFVNGPGATLFVNSVTFANGFTNEGRIAVQGVAHHVTTFGVSNGTLVNAPGGIIQVGGGETAQVALHADLDNQGLLTAGFVLFSKPSGTLTNSGTMSILSATVESNEAFTNNGEVTIVAGGTLTVAGRSFDQNGTVDGPGTLALSGTTANFPGDLSDAVTGLSIRNTTLNLGGTLTNVRSLDIGGSTINAPLVNQGTLTVNNTGATAVLNGPFTNANGATLNVVGSLTIPQGFTNDGAIDLTGTLTVAGGALTNATDGTIAGQGGTLSAQLDNQGAITVAQDTFLNGTVANEGTIDVQSGNLMVDLTDPTTPLANAGTITVESLAALVVDGGDFTNAGTVTVGLFGTLVVSGGYTQTGSQTILANGSLTAGGLVDLEGGVLTGSGMVNANVLNNAEVDVGQPGSPGTLTIIGDYTQAAGGNLVIEIGGFNPGTDFDQLNITGQATLDGTLTVNLINGFQPASGQGLTILTFGAGSGAFANLAGDGPLFTPSFDATDVTLVAN